LCKEAGNGKILTSLLSRGLVVTCMSSPVRHRHHTNVTCKKKASGEWRMVQDLRAVKDAVYARAPVVPTQSLSFLLSYQIQFGLQLLIWLMDFLAFLCTQILSTSSRFLFNDSTISGLFCAKVTLRGIFAYELSANLL
jgi:hypothetical protein